MQREDLDVMNILKFLFIVLFIFLPIYQIGRFQMGNGIAITINDILVTSVSIVWIIQSLLKKRVVKNLNFPLARPIIIFIIVAFLSLIINIPNLRLSELFVSSLYLIRWVLYVCIFFVVVSFNIHFKQKIVYLLTGSSFVIVLLGFAQYFFYPNLRNLYYLGWDEHMHRMFSTFLDPNFAGTFFVLYLIFLSGMLLYFLKNKQKNLVIVNTATLLLTFSAIYLTFSRSALIMLFVSFFIFLILIRKISLMLLLIAASLIFITISSKNFYIENINLFRIASTEARLDSAKNALHIIKDNPILGVGFNGYRYAQIRYGFRHGQNGITSHADAGTDNSFLFVLATTGFVGLFAYLYLLFSLLSRAYLNYKLSKNIEIKYYMSIIALASFVGIIIDSLFINSLFYSFNMIWLWILVGLLDSKDPDKSG